MKIMRISAIALAALLLGQAAFAGEEAADAGPTLYERMGGWDGVDQIVADTLALHQVNEEIVDILDGIDLERLHANVTAFFAAGTGGPNKYEGRDMTTAHAPLGLTEADFDAAVSDVLKAVAMNVEDAAVAEEVNAILQSLRPAVMGTAGN
ncbi:MAG: group 1 truncated hemoglobin [Woeseiaceae bacterium]|jgi:hemoglobin